MARMVSKYQVSDELWARIEPLLPEHVNTHPFGGGKPRTPDRVCMNAIYFVLRTGCQWGALDATGICPHSTAHDRFQAWVKDGLFLRLWATGLMEYDELKGIDWAWLSGDGAMTKAPLAGGKNRPQSHGSSQARHQTKPANGRSRGPAGAGGRRRQRQRLQAPA